MANATKAGRHDDGAAMDARRRAHARFMRRLNMTVTVIMMVAAVVLMSWPWVMQQITASGMLNEVTSAESTVGSLPAEAYFPRKGTGVCDRDQILREWKSPANPSLHDRRSGI